MAAETKIQWTHHTFNPWRGCAKVSPGCANCYAEELSHRNPKVLGEWGPGSRRAIAAETYWQDPLRWNRSAHEAEERRRVFCASLGDVFEGREDLDPHRARLLDLIARTPSLDWLLLTKRPQLVPLLLSRLVNGPRRNNHEINAALIAGRWLDGHPLPNVWLGASVEDQQRAYERVPDLLEIPAKVRFLSIEPLLGPIDFTDGPLNRDESTMGDWSMLDVGIHWIILGGESGSEARACHIDWMRSIILQARQSRVAVFVKQLGAQPWLPHEVHEGMPSWVPLHLVDKKGGDPSDWPEDLRIREFPAVRG